MARTDSFPLTIFLGKAYYDTFNFLFKLFLFFLSFVAQSSSFLSFTISTQSYTYLHILLFQFLLYVQVHQWFRYIQGTLKWEGCRFVFLILIFNYFLGRKIHMGRYYWSSCFSPRENLIQHYYFKLALSSSRVTDFFTLRLQVEKWSERVLR